jgi:hypothetical protein
MGLGETRPVRNPAAVVNTASRRSDFESVKVATANVANDASRTLTLRTS